MKGFKIVQWINLNHNNKYGLASTSIFCILRKETDSILLQLVGLMAGKQADRQNKGGIQNF